MCLLRFEFDTGFDDSVKEAGYCSRVDENERAKEAEVYY